MSTKTAWTPQPRHTTSAHVLALARRLGLSDDRELLAFSVARPDAYWDAALSFIGVRWSRRPDGYVDLARGKEFPRWFPGGRLNWVETVLAFAETPAGAARRAIVAEEEDGAVRSLTYGELAPAVRRFAAGLAGLGVRRGDRVGLLCDNGVEATISVLAIAYMGAVVVPLFSGFGDEAIVSRLEPSGAKALIATTGFFRRGKYVDMEPVIAAAVARLPSIGNVVWKVARGAALPAAGVDWRALAATADDGRPAQIMDPMDPFMVIYTSGTTGRPKGPVHTHGGFPLKIAHDAAVHFNIGEGDVFCWPADMGWIAGTLVLSCALMRGATLVLYNGAPDFPDWSRMSQLIERHAITHYGSSPTLIRGLAASEALALKHDRASLRLLITAGEVIDPEHFAWYQDVFGGGASPVVNYTGGTEVSGALLSSVQCRPIDAGRFNTASPGVDVTVVDAAGDELVGEVGELAIRAPFVGMTASFWQDDERYLDSYWRAIPGMWVHGDLAVKSADGAFVMMGRSDDTLKVAGKRLGPAEVEEIVLELDDVSEAAAVGIHDSVKGQKLVVFAIPAPGFAGDRRRLAQDVADRVGERLGKPFRPSQTHLVGQLPKTRSGKIMRRLIRQAYVGEKLGDLSSLDNPAALDEIAALAVKA